MKFGKKIEAAFAYLCVSYYGEKIRDTLPEKKKNPHCYTTEK
jgi:hypothetical protein